MIPIVTIEETEAPLVAADLRRAIDAVFATLMPREERALRLLFGMGCPVHTCSDIAREFGITRSRAGQIVKKAMRKMQHPQRANRLRGAWDGTIYSKPLRLLRAPTPFKPRALPPTAPMPRPRRDWLWLNRRPRVMRAQDVMPWPSEA